MQKHQMQKNWCWRSQDIAMNNPDHLALRCLKLVCGRNVSGSRAVDCCNPRILWTMLNLNNTPSLSTTSNSLKTQARMLIETHSDSNVCTLEVSEGNRGCIGSRTIDSLCYILAKDFACVWETPYEFKQIWWRKFMTAKPFCSCMVVAGWF